MLGYHWYITRDISISAVREIRSVRRGQVLVPQLGWEYNKQNWEYPHVTNCMTVR